MSTGYKIIAIIPAHNEENTIEKTIQSLLLQVDKIIVACDNCTDYTYKKAIAAGAVAFNTANNTGRKAGALNQALKNYIDLSNDNQLIVICDADTQIYKNWVKRALIEMNRKSVIAVGSVFEADNNKGYLRFCQYLEWERYTLEILRKRKVFVLTGTASIIKLSALKKIYSKNNYFYDENSITEDFTLTLDLKELGGEILSPISCKCKTETMPSIKLLFLQRRRWYLGALQQIVRRKKTKVLLPYIFQQIMLLLSITSFLGLIIFQIYLFATEGFFFSNFWLVIGLIFIFERVITVWNVGWKARIFALLTLPELIYAFILQMAYLGALIQLFSKSKGSWNHIE